MKCKKKNPNQKPSRRGKPEVRLWKVCPRDRLQPEAMKGTTCLRWSGNERFGREGTGAGQAPCHPRREPHQGCVGSCFSSAEKHAPFCRQKYVLGMFWGGLSLHFLKLHTYFLREIRKDVTV